MIKRVSEKEIRRIGEIMDLYVRPTWPLSSVKAAAEKEGNVFLYSEDSGEVIGYVCFERVLDEAELTSIAVVPDARRKGTAAALICEGLKLLSGVRKIFLEVDENNSPAISLYEKTGFKRISTRKGYYGDSDAVIMELDI